VAEEPGVYPDGMVGAPQLLIILVVILVLFGGAKLPQLARSLGQAQKEFKKGIEEGDETETGTPETDRPT
jgi:sec-independent protein translocase protein TatA